VSGPEPFRCPTCGAPVARRAERRPFCSERCRLVDLGRWFAGAYALPSEGDAVDPPGAPGEDGSGDA
jgi:endogenous inhibitor of DNA gyrase (YacG/DUF329 family)